MTVDVREIKLPEHIAKALAALVDIAERNNLLTLHYRRVINDDKYTIASAVEWGKQTAPLFVAVAAAVLTVLQIIQALLALL